MAKCLLQYVFNLFYYIEAKHISTALFFSFFFPFFLGKDFQPQWEQIGGLTIQMGSMQCSLQEITPFELDQTWPKSWPWPGPPQGHHKPAPAPACPWDQVRASPPRLPCPLPLRTIALARSCPTPLLPNTHLACDTKDVLYAGESLLYHPAQTLQAFDNVLWNTSKYLMYSLCDKKKKNYLASFWNLWLEALYC